MKFNTLVTKFISSKDEQVLGKLTNLNHISRLYQQSPENIIKTLNAIDKPYPHYEYFTGDVNSKGQGYQMTFTEWEPKFDKKGNKLDIAIHFWKDDEGVILCWEPYIEMDNRRKILSNNGPRFSSIRCGYVDGLISHFGFAAATTGMTSANNIPAYQYWIELKGPDLKRYSTPDPDDSRIKAEF